jgi:hypothetical protein
MDHPAARAIAAASFITGLSACLAPLTFAQSHSADRSYIDSIPLEYPRLVHAVDATERLHLYGDPESLGYRDLDPVDGIDDDRQRSLQRLAVRFAPILVQNTVITPIDFRLWTEGQRSFPMYVDTWEVSQHEADLVTSDAIDVTLLGSEHACEDVPAAPDCRLLDVLTELNPLGPADDRSRTLTATQNADYFKVLFFDFPGSSEDTWKETYEDDFTGELRKEYRYPKSFVHPFIHEEGTGPDSDQRYDLVLQYWLFYPFNDGGNNHEGDWEHINVVVAPRSVVDRPQTVAEIESMLRDPNDQADPLVIKRVEYYFHHNVFIMDYTRPNVYRSRQVWSAEVAGMTEDNLGAKKVWQMIRRLAYWDDEETIVNTNPIGYIGADNKGLDQVLAFPGGKNRDSHGTYPFPGVFKSIGPAGATEEITAVFDHRKHFKEGRFRRQERYRYGNAVPYDRLERIEIIPDWERVWDLVLEDPEARRRWSWLVLPIYWGYPTAESPFATLVGHVDLGNLSALGPAYNNGWNRSGTGASYGNYTPHRFSSAVPLGWTDSFENNLGFLNLTVPTLFSLPPLDFIWRVVSLPVRAPLGRSHPTYFPSDNIPFRFFGLSGGISLMGIPNDVLDLIANPDQLDPLLIDVLRHMIENGADETTAITGGTENVDAGVTANFQLFFNIGKRLTTENTLRNARADLTNTYTFSNIEDYQATGVLNLWEYAGSFRYNLATGKVQPFLKAGYGISWYRIEQLAGDGAELEAPNSPWVRKPSLKGFKNILPNTWHLGIGLEVIPFRSFATAPKGVDVGFRIEYLGFNHRLGVDESNLPLERLVQLGFGPADIPRDRRIWRSDFAFGLTVGF